MWTFEITTGKFFDPSNAYVSSGYSGGNCGKNPEGINNPDMCSVPDIGPIPPGLYTMGEAVMHSKLGIEAIPLTPDPSNEMYGRKDFYLHGDTAIPRHASEGCIIQPREARDKAKASSDRQLQVVISKE